MHLRAVLRQPEGSAANFSGDAAEPLNHRASERRSLTLFASTKSPAAGEIPVLILDISEGGLLLEAKNADLFVDDHIQIELPERGQITARVAWRSEPFFGCQFSEPVAPATISAALLKAAPQVPATSAIAAEPLAAPRTRFGLEPELNFSAAFLLALAAWGVIGLAVYTIIS